MKQIISAAIMAAAIAYTGYQFSQLREAENNDRGLGRVVVSPGSAKYTFRNLMLAGEGSMLQRCHLSKFKSEKAYRMRDGIGTLLRVFKCIETQMHFVSPSTIAEPVNVEKELAMILLDSGESVLVLEGNYIPISPNKLVEKHQEQYRDIKAKTPTKDDDNIFFNIGGEAED